MRFYKAKILFLLAAACLLLTACQSPADSSSSSTSSVSSETSSQATPTPEATATPAPTEEPSSSETKSENTDNSCFENSAFVGNSMLEDLDMYGIIDNADFYAKTGLTVTNVFTETTVDGTAPIMEEVTSKKYDKVFLMFGLNELGWSYPEVFIDDYRTLIETLQKDEPGAEIYVQSLTPVSAERSKENLYGVTNERIVEYNDMLRELCADMDVTFVDVAAAVCNDQGILPDGAAPDGVHLNMDYCKKWVSALRTAIEN